MTWHWRKVASCDLDELMGDLNPQMKDLEGELGARRPAIMAGYPDAVGVITDPASVDHTGDTTETTLKSVDFGRGALGDKAGFRITAAGICSGTVSTKNIKLKWGGITVLTLNVQAGNAKQWALTAEFWNISTTQQQRYLIKAWDGTTLEHMLVGSESVDTL